MPRLQLQPGNITIRPDNENPQSDARDNNFSFDIGKSPSLRQDLGAGDDEVELRTTNTDEIRVTFTSSEVGNGNPRDANTLANQDGGLAVRLQAEDAMGNLIGPVSRFDDEGIEFTSKDGAKFDVRDLVSGAERGNTFDEVLLGTSGADTFNFSSSLESYYINAGMGDDTITGSTVRDFLVGGAGNDTINGLAGNDSFIGGGGMDTFVFTGAAGNDTINDFVSGTDKIDFKGYGIADANVTSAVSGTSTVLSVDSNNDSAVDFTITLLNVSATASSDFVFA